MTTYHRKEPKRYKDDGIAVYSTRKKSQLNNNITIAVEKDGALRGLGGYDHLVGAC